MLAVIENLLCYKFDSSLRCSTFEIELYVITILIHYMLLYSVACCFLSSIFSPQPSPISTAEPNQSIANMASPEDQSMNEMISENEPIASEEASEVALENSATTNAATSRLGLLSLPPELRVLVFRHLLLEDRILSTHWLDAGYQPLPAILSTCKRIREEAFQVLYGENVFSILMHPTHTILYSREIRDTIQNMRFDVRLNEPWLDLRRFYYFFVIRELLSPAIVRGTLSLHFHVSPRRHALPPWFVRILHRFTDFRVIRVEYFVDRPLPSVVLDSVPLPPPTGRDVCESHQHTFTPVFGPATPLAKGCGCLFRPQTYLNSQTPKADVDWTDHLDGIRLHWNQDPTCKRSLRILGGEKV